MRQKKTDKKPSEYLALLVLESRYILILTWSINVMAWYLQQIFYIMCSKNLYYGNFVLPLKSILKATLGAAHPSPFYFLLKHENITLPFL